MTTDVTFYCGVRTHDLQTPGGFRPVSLYGCMCGHPSCSDIWLSGLGKFTQGSGFDRKEAERIADTWNAGELVRLFRKRTEDAIIARDAIKLEEMYQSLDEAKRVFEDVHLAYEIG